MDQLQDTRVPARGWGTNARARYEIAAYHAPFRVKTPKLRIESLNPKFPWRRASGCCSVAAVDQAPPHNPILLHHTATAVPLWEWNEICTTHRL